MSRKIFLVLIALLLILSLTGCSLLGGLLGDISDVLSTYESGQQGTFPQSSSWDSGIDLSIDKTAYERLERVAVTLDFDKLDKDAAVIVIVASDTEHGSENAVDESLPNVEYRLLSDFSELPFYLWAPDADGLFDVRVYADGDGGDELASVSFTVGNVPLSKQSTGKTQKNGDSLWFSDEVLEEMKLSGFTQPDGFEVLTEAEMPDNMENDPYLRVIKGSPNMDGYFPVIDKVYALLEEAYGEAYTWNYYPTESPSYKWESELNYGGDPFYVWDGDTIRSVSFTFSGSWDGVEGEVLQIVLCADADDPRDDYDRQ